MILQEFKDASIIHLYKQKVNCQTCDIHQGISLSLHWTARKILTWITEQPHCALWPGTTARRPVWIPKWMWDHHHCVCCEAATRKISRAKHWPFLHLKAFGTVSRNCLWKVIYINGAAFLQGNADTSSGQWFDIWAIHSNQWHQAGVCFGTETVQFIVVCPAD